MSGYVYCLYDKPNNICRIGMSTVSDGSRVKNQLSYYPHKLQVTKVNVYDPLFAETYLHQLFKSLKVNGSWYRITPDIFLKYINEYLEQKILEVRKWVDDEVKRGIKLWKIKTIETYHVVELICAYPRSNKCLFKKDNKQFYAIFKNALGYFTAKNGTEVEVTIVNKSKTQKIKASVVLSYVENADPLVVDYVKNYKSEDRNEKFIKRKMNIK